MCFVIPNMSTAPFFTSPTAMKLPALLLALPLFAGAAFAQDNPHMDDFDLEGSDARAVAIADQVMEALGGRTNWDNTRYLTWSFFGDDQVWDKWTGRFRWQEDSLVVLMNINTQEGVAYADGELLPDSDEIVARAYRSWANSGYWLLMPYKLKDSGVTLGYKGEGTTEDGRAAEILTLRFREVGHTPDNRYDVYVDMETRLVTQWSYYATGEDEAPRFTRPWENWTQHGNIMLSDGRGMRGDVPFNLPNVGVYEDLPDSVFEYPARIDIAALAH